MAGIFSSRRNSGGSATPFPAGTAQSSTQPLEGSVAGEGHVGGEGYEPPSSETELTRPSPPAFGRTSSMTRTSSALVKSVTKRVRGSKEYLFTSGQKSRGSTLIMDPSLGDDHPKNIAIKTFAASPLVSRDLIEQMWAAFSAATKSILGALPSPLLGGGALGDGSLGLPSLLDEAEDYGGMVVPFAQIDQLIANNTAAWSLPEEALSSHKDYVSLLRRDVLEELNEGRADRKQDGHMDFEAFVHLVAAIKEQRVPSQLIKHAALPINPDCAFKQIWDVSVMMFLFYTCFSVPYTLAFDVGPSTTLSVYNVFDIFLDVIFMIDVSLSFVTGYWTQGTLIMDLRPSALHYARTWFIPDIAGSFPFDKVINAAYANQEGGAGGTDLGSMRILKAVRMFKLLRAAKFMEHLSKLEQREGFQAVKKPLRILKSSFVMVFIAHLLGCLFTMLIDTKSTDNWLYAYDPDVFYSDNLQRYMVALYWAIITVSTMGYGDVLPVNHSERIFAIFVSVFGAVVFSYCMANMTAMITQTTGADARFDDQLRLVTEYLEYRGVPPHIKLKIKRHLHICMRRSPHLYEEESVLNALPASLRREVLRSLHGDAETLPFLDGLDDECLGSILTRMNVQNFVRGQTIYHAEDVGAEMYLVTEGTVHVKHHLNLNDDRETPLRKDEVVTLGSGDTFGEIALFPDICKYRGETVTAASDCRLMVLSRSDLCVVSESYPVLEEKLRNLCMLLSIDSKLNNHVIESKIFRRNQDKAKEGGLDLKILELSDKVRSTKEALLVRRKGGRNSSPVFSAWRRRVTRQGGSTATAPLSGLARPLNVFQSAEDGEEWLRLSMIIKSDGSVLAIPDSIQGLTASEPLKIGYLHKGSPCKVLKRRLNDPGLSGKARRAMTAKKLSQRHVCRFHVSPHKPLDEGELDDGSVTEVVLAADSLGELKKIMTSINGWVSSPPGSEPVVVIDLDLEESDEDGARDGNSGVSRANSSSATNVQDSSLISITSAEEAPSAHSPRALPETAPNSSDTRSTAGVVLAALTPPHPLEPHNPPREQPPSHPRESYQASLLPPPSEESSPRPPGRRRGSSTAQGGRRRVSGVLLEPPVRISDNLKHLPSLLVGGNGQVGGLGEEGVVPRSPSNTRRDSGTEGGGGAGALERRVKGVEARVEAMDERLDARMLAIEDKVDTVLRKMELSLIRLTQMHS